MSLPVTPPDPTRNQPHVIVDKERRRSAHAKAGKERFDLPHDEPLLDSIAPVSVDAGTGAALASLDAVDTVPLATAISRYGEDA